MTDKCEDRIENALESRIEDLQHLYDSYRNVGCPTCEGTGELYDEEGVECEDCKGTGKMGDEDGNSLKDEGHIYEYGLGFDYVNPESEPCEDCEGTGGGIQCIYCDNTGEDEEGETCTCCEGVEFECGTCEGTGKAEPKEGYFRYQLSWGGPSEEFRIYAYQTGEYSFDVYRIQFVFLDWFDGAKRTLTSSDFRLVEEIFQNLFVETGTASHAMEEARED